MFARRPSPPSHRGYFPLWVCVCVCLSLWTLSRATTKSCVWVCLPWRSCLPLTNSPPHHITLSVTHLMPINGKFHNNVAFPITAIISHKQPHKNKSFVFFPILFPDFKKENRRRRTVVLPPECFLLHVNCDGSATAGILTQPSFIVSVPQCAYMHVCFMDSRAFNITPTPPMLSFICAAEPSINQ